MNNIRFIEWLEAQVMACDVCGTVYDMAGEQSPYVEGAKCGRSVCLDGTYKSISPFLLPSVTMLNRHSPVVEDSQIEVCNPSWVEISLTFKDAYGNHFTGPPAGFEFDIDPNSMKHNADTPIKLERRIDIRGKSDLGLYEAIQDAILNLYTWAKDGYR